MCKCKNCGHPIEDDVCSVGLEPLVRRRNEFLKKLHSLLKEFDAEITAEDHWIGYAECGEDIRMTIEFNDRQIKDIDIGCWIDGEKHGGA